MDELVKQLLHFGRRWVADWLISWSGHPWLSHCWAPVYRGCPCRDPPVWWLIQAGWWVTKAPTLFCCTALVFCCAATSWGWTTVIALLTCSLATLPNLTNAVYSSYDAGKSNQLETWLDVSCVAGKLNWTWHAPSAMRVHVRIHNRIAEVFSRSLTRSLRLVSVFLCLLVLWGSRASWFASSPVPWLPSPCWWWKVRSSNWSSTCVCSLSSSTSSLPITVALWQFHCRGFSSQCCFAVVPVNELHNFPWTTPDCFPHWATWHYPNHCKVTTSSGFFTTSSTQKHSDDMVIHSPFNLQSVTTLLRKVLTPPSHHRLPSSSPNCFHPEGLDHDALHFSLCIRETLLVSFQIGSYLALPLNWSHTSLLHLAVSLSNFCLITMSFVCTLSNDPCVAIHVLHLGRWIHVRLVDKSGHGLSTSTTWLSHVDLSDCCSRSAVWLSNVDFSLLLLIRDTSSPSEPCSVILRLHGFFDVTLYFILSLVHHCLLFLLLKFLTILDTRLLLLGSVSSHSILHKTQTSSYSGHDCINTIFDQILQVLEMLVHGAALQQLKLILAECTHPYRASVSHRSLLAPSKLSTFLTFTHSRLAPALTQTH